MSSTKVNLYLSYTGDDRSVVQKLLIWLYPMRDEVNIIYANPPRPLESMTLPWRLLLFWYEPPDPRAYYVRYLGQQLEQAHIYVFLTSYKSLADGRIEKEIETAVSRQIQHSDRYIRIFPLEVSPSHWRKHSRLSRYKTIGPRQPLSQAKPEEEAYLTIIDQLAKEIKTVQRNLDELKYARTRPGEASKAWPDLLGEIPPFKAPEAVSPPEWLGWVILIAIIVSIFYSLGPELPTAATGRFRNIEKESKPPEFPREYPLVPNPMEGDTIIGRK